MQRSYLFNDAEPTEVYSLSLHDALPICSPPAYWITGGLPPPPEQPASEARISRDRTLRMERLLRLRSEEHTSELQSQSHLVCRLLLEKKNRIILQSPAPRNTPTRNPAHQ